MDSKSANLLCKMSKWVKIYCIKDKPLSKLKAKKAFFKINIKVFLRFVMYNERKQR